MAYLLEFETMMQIIREHRQTGKLCAEVPGGVGRLQEPCRIEAAIKEGKCLALMVEGSSRRQLTSKEATEAVRFLGRVHWTFTPYVDHPSAPASMPPAHRGIARRLVPLTHEQMQTWPRLHRAVFSLVDGSRDLVKIAQMLSTPPELIENVFDELQSMGYLSVERSDHS